MQRRMIICKGKKYLVNVPDYSGDDFGIWMESTGSITLRVLENDDIRITEDGLYRIIE